MHNFKIYLTNSPGDNGDRFTIAINQHLIDTYSLDINNIEFDISLAEGQNVLHIELIKNTRNYTKINIDEIFINDSAMKYMLNDFGQVIPNWHRDPGLKEWFIQQEGHAPDYFAKRRVLDMEGIYEFRFKVPLRGYMEEFYKIPESYKTQYNRSLDRYLKLEERLNGR